MADAKYKQIAEDLREQITTGTLSPGSQLPTEPQLAAAALAQADPGWLAGLITRRVPLSRGEDAYSRSPDDIKTVLSFPDASA